MKRGEEVRQLAAEQEAFALHFLIFREPGARICAVMQALRDQIIEDIKHDDEEIRQFHQEIIRKHLQSTYLARMQLGRMIDKALAERSISYVREIYESLRGVCVASRDNQPIGDKMIMNAAFLVERHREAEFDNAVNKVAKKHGQRLKFKYTGPWPPYNFVNIRLKLERVAEG